MIKFFLQIGFDPNIKNEEGLTALHLALSPRNKDLICLLMEWNADPLIPNPKSQVPLFDTLDPWRVDEKLFWTLFRPFDVNRICLGKTVLFAAIQSRRLKYVRKVLEYGADPNIHGYGGITPMHCAIYNIPCLKLLIEFGGNLEVEDEDGETPLMNALYDAGFSSVGYILEQGAIPRFQNKRGQSFLLYALYRIKVKEVEFLKRYGVDFSIIICDDEGKTLYNFACLHGRTDLLPYLI